MKATGRFLVLMLAVIIALTTRGSIVAQGQTTVTVWMHEFDQRITIDKELIAQFEKDNPNIKVTYVTIPAADFDTKLATALASGSGPDLFNQFTGYVGQFFVQGILAPIDPVAMGFKSQDEVYARYGEAGKTLLAGATFNNTLYGLPTELSIYACFTNDDLWQKAGLDPAKDYPATWEDMVEVAKKLTVRDAGGVPTQRAFDMNWSASIFTLLTLNPMVQQLGGNMIDEVNYTAALNTPEVKKVMGYWNDWVNTYKFGGPQYTDSRTAFQNKELAIECTYGNWGVPITEGNKIKYSIHPLPRWKNAVHDNGSSIYAYFFMANASSPAPVQSAAWKLAAYLTSQPARYFKDAGLFQPVADFVASPEFKADKIMPVFLSEMSKSFYHPRIAGFNEVLDALARTRDRIIVGHEDMDKVLAEAQDEVTGILAKALKDAQAAVK